MHTAADFSLKPEIGIHLSGKPSNLRQVVNVPQKLCRTKAFKLLFLESGTNDPVSAKNENSLCAFVRRHPGSGKKENMFSQSNKIMGPQQGHQEKRCVMGVEGGRGWKNPVKTMHQFRGRDEGHGGTPLIRGHISHAHFSLP